MVSVALAAFKGRKYMEEQLNSILGQTVPVDEIVVSLDKSDDGTLDVLNNYKHTSGRFKVFPGPSSGIVKNFENAINKCCGDVIFLCDQDDVWNGKKVEIVLNEFNRDPKIGLVIHDALVVDEELNVFCESFFKKNGSRVGKLKNIVKNSYIGCCMAFSSKLKDEILPFPDQIPMHDQWIGLVAELTTRVKFLELPLIKYRRHKNNATCIKHSSVLKMLRWRYNLIKSLLARGCQC